MDSAFLSQTPLFLGCTQEEINRLLACLCTAPRAYRRGEILFHAGEPVTGVGLVLTGSVQIAHTDSLGNTNILSLVGPGGVFAEAYACIPDEPLMVDVRANRDCTVLFVSVPRLFAPCDAPCPCHTRLIRNLTLLCARKSLSLSRRILHTAAKTIRGRVLSYLSEQTTLQGSRRVVLPFDRQQLADYLGVDRSALCKELGRMKRDGLLDYRKNTFELHAQPRPFDPA